MSKHRSRNLILLAIVIGLTLVQSGRVFAGFDYSSVGHNARVIYDEGGHRSWHMGESFIRAKFSERALGLVWNLSVGHIETTGDLRFGYYGSPESAPAAPPDVKGGRLSGRLRLQEPYSRGLFTVQTPEGMISTSVEVKVKANERTEASGALQLQPARFLGVRFETCKFYPLPPSIDLYFAPNSEDGPIAFEGGSLEMRCPARADNLEVTISPLDKLTVDISSRLGLFIQDRPDYGDVPMGTYTGHLYGRWSELNLNARKHWNSGMSGTLRFRELDLGLDSLAALDGGLKFAYFGKVRGYAQWWSCKVEDSTWYSSVSTGNAEGEFKGVIQAWPFLRGLYSFLGERRHLVLDGKMSWIHASAGVSALTSRGFSVWVATEYLCVKPDLHYGTWRPAFIGMGVDDLIEGRYEIVRADLAKIRLTPMVKFKYWRLILDISQWIPIHIRKVESTTVATPSGTDFESSSVWGGFSLFVTIETHVR